MEGMVHKVTPCDLEAFKLRTGISPDDLFRLSRLPLFANLAQDELCVLLETSTVRRYSQDATLFLEGEAAECFYIVMEGWIKLYRLCEDGHEVVISVISKGETFAEAAIFDQHIYPVSASVMTNARLLVVSGESLIRKVTNNPDFALSMLGSMSRHLRANVATMHKLSAMSSTERLADFLCGLADTINGEAIIKLPLDKSLIAARLGMQPETFSRALAKLKNIGVQNSGQDIVIEDVSTLRESIKHAAVG